MGVALALCIVALHGCEKSSSSAPAPVITAERKLPGEPIIRVRILRDADSVTFTSPTKIQVYPLTDPTRKQLVSTPLTVKLSVGQWAGDTVSAFPRNSVLVIDPLGPSPLGVGKSRYPGALRLYPGAAGNTFDVINHVRLEAYLPGVLEHELYDHWAPATYLAQAIAARSYAISRMMDDGPGRYYDVESTQASQAYAGAATTAICTQAVADTMGLVLTYRGQVLTAYYSSTCGGTGQSEADAFGAATPLAPLAPRRVRSWCSASRYYEWGPITRDRIELSRRIGAWGQAYGLTIGQLGNILHINTTARNELGRPVQFEIVDDRGHAYKLRGESFRIACNYANADLKLPPTGSDRLLSSHVDVEVRGEKVVFANGHGFGHGVGLCQYGAEGMARAGFNPLQILDEYYPGAKVERAY